MVHSGPCGHNGLMKILGAFWIVAGLVAGLAIIPALAQSGAGTLAADVTGSTSKQPQDGKPGASERPQACYTAREMSDRVARLRLSNPLIAMQSNARRLRADPLRTRLCRSGGRLIYELSLIRRDGKVLRIHVNAQNGRTISPQRQ